MDFAITGVTTCGSTRCERPSFGLRKVAFHRAFDGLLQRETWPFAKPVGCLRLTVGRRLNSTFSHLFIVDKTKRCTFAQNMSH